MILAIDTATRWTGLALYDGSQLVAELGWSSRQMQTVSLAPAMADMQRQTGVKSADLTAIAVIIGPGSYTGVRIGVAFAKGLALALNIPLLGVNTLDATMAGLPPSSRPFVAVAEAGRGRVCAAVYRWDEATHWKMSDSADLYEWSSLLHYAPEGSCFVGELSAENRQQIEGAGKAFDFLAPVHAARRAGYIAEIGYQRLLRHEIDDPAALFPIYLRDPGSHV